MMFEGTWVVQSINGNELSGASSSPCFVGPVQPELIGMSMTFAANDSLGGNYSWKKKTAVSCGTSKEVGKYEWIIQGVELKMVYDSTFTEKYNDFNPAENLSYVSKPFPGDGPFEQFFSVEIKGKKLILSNQHFTYEAEK